VPSPVAKQRVRQVYVDEQEDGTDGIVELARRTGNVHDDRDPGANSKNIEVPAENQDIPGTPYRTQTPVAAMSPVVQQHGIVTKAGHLCADVRQTLIPVQDPESVFIRSWNWMILLPIVWLCVITTCRLGFGENRQTRMGIIIFCDWVSEIVFLADVLLHFRIGFLDHVTDELIMDERPVALKYLRTWFVPDLLSSIPIEMSHLNTYESSSRSSWIFVVKVLRLSKIFRLRKVEAFSSTAPSITRLVNLIAVFLFCVHMVACMYWFMSEKREFGSDDWVPSQRFVTAPFVAQYGRAVYWALLALIGADMYPSDDGEVRGVRGGSVVHL
jgi:hypothetical protein